MVAWDCRVAAALQSSACRLYLALQHCPRRAAARRCMAAAAVARPRLLRHGRLELREAKQHCLEVRPQPPRDPLRLHSRRTTAPQVLPPSSKRSQDPRVSSAGLPALSTRASSRRRSPQRPVGTPKHRRQRLRCRPRMRHSTRRARRCVRRGLLSDPHVRCSAHRVALQVPEVEAPSGRRHASALHRASFVAWRRRRPPRTPATRIRPCHRGAGRTRQSWRSCSRVTAPRATGLRFR
mmetsp:Transcript_55325/g.118984  ORF Transcript_55325/g.118984 Transcript_55325/m.118984 type:complete len:237 (-) Transcript_55325:171-881(-)